MPRRARLFYGWKITATLALTETVSWGILYYAFSVFLVPMQEDLGWSLTVLTGAYSLALLLSGLCAPLAGRWLDRRGPRLLMTGGSLLGAICVFAWSRADSVIGYYLVWAGIGIAMSATLYEPAFATLIRWFDRGRNKAFLIVTIAAGFASTIFLPLSGVLAERFGWRQALVLLAGLLAIITVPLHGLVLRRNPRAVGQEVDGLRAPLPREAPAAVVTVASPELSMQRVLRDHSFWWLTAAFVLQSFASVGVGVMLIPYLTERGVNPAFAATVTGFIGAAQVLSRIVSTICGDRISAVTLTAAVFALQAVALLVLMGWQARSGVIAAVLLLGAGRGVVTLMRPQLVGDFYGKRHYGAINGTLALFLTAAGALAPISIGLGYGFFGAYVPILWGMVLLSLAASLAMLWLGRQRRLGELILASGN